MLARRRSGASNDPRRARPPDLRLYQRVRDAYRRLRVGDAGARVKRPFASAEQAPTLSSLAKEALRECEDRTDDAVDLLVEWLVDDPVLQRAIIDAAVMAANTDKL
jgi:hypothetical protein